MLYALCPMPYAFSLPQGPEGRTSSLLGFVAMRFALCFFSCLKAEGQSSNLKARRAGP
jgi:hypothetical protein